MSAKLNARLPEVIAGVKSRSTNVQKVLAVLPTTQCVPWPGKSDTHGYGWIDSKVTHLAHRYVWILLLGKPPLPELDHLCRNTACVNPAHLEPVTAQENSRRRAAAMTHCRNGHQYGVDEYVSPQGLRYCRACRRDVDRKRRPAGSRAKERTSA